MLEISTSPETPTENADGGSGSKADHGEDGDRNSSANRWPREETIALLNIRSEMDVAFKDTNPKGPLWEQVSRRLAEVGYNRSAKKCKEKFENIYKYHRRTKEGRCGKSNATKTYRFFDQLEALDGNHSHSLTLPTTIDNNDVILNAVPFSVSAACSKKRRLTQFLEGLMREVIEKQENLQRKFMEVLDKCEKDRMAREEAWKNEELARIKKERELLAQERSIAAAKDEAVLAFLRRFAEAEGTLHLLDNIQLQNGNVNGDVTEMDKVQECGNNSVGSFVHMSSSRWPKDEVEALIRLRTRLDLQAQGNSNNNNNNNGSKGPLWEEISSAMKNLGYDRSAKRCKEKWENINKYFKRMKEKNKRKPQDSKTCPYYHHLEALYSKKPKKLDQNTNSGNELKPEELLLHIMESQSQEQQQQMQQQTQSSSEDAQRDTEDQSGYQNQMVDNNPSSIAIMG